MSVERIAGRYAKSLVDLAIEKKVLEAVIDDMQLFTEVVKNRDFYLMTKSPVIPPDKKIAIFRALFTGKVDALSLAFFEIIIRKGREEYLREISQSCIVQYKKLKNITTAKITSAVALSGNNLKNIQAKIKDSLATGATVELSSEEDPKIIGGFILEIEDKIYDASVKSDLLRLRKEIMSNTYIK